MKSRLLTIILMMATATAMAGELKWEKHYDKALDQAKKDNKIVMVDFYTEWCGWCKKLDKDVYSNAQVAEKLGKSFIPVKLNPEENKKNQKLAEKFGVRGYPTIIFVDGTGKEISKIGGYVPADEFSKRLDELAKKSK